MIFSQLERNSEHMTLTRHIFKTIPELLDLGVRDAPISAIVEVTVEAGELMTEVFRFPQISIQTFVQSGHQHRLKRHQTIFSFRKLLKSTDIKIPTACYFQVMKSQEVINP